MTHSRQRGQASPDQGLDQVRRVGHTPSSSITPAESEVSRGGARMWRRRGGELVDNSVEASLQRASGMDQQPEVAPVLAPPRETSDSPAITPLGNASHARR